MSSLKSMAVLAAAIAIGAVNATAQLGRMPAQPPSNDLVRSLGLFDWLFGGSPQPPGPPSPPCERQCPSRSRLYVYRNPGEDAEQMVDLKNEAYSQLPTAFRFQTAYDSQCTCRGNPWDPEEIARHAAYPPT